MLIYSFTLCFLFVPYFLCSSLPLFIPSIEFIEYFLTFHFIFTIGLLDIPFFYDTHLTCSLPSPAVVPVYINVRYSLTTVNLCFPIPILFYTYYKPHNKLLLFCSYQQIVFQRNFKMRKKLIYVYTHIFCGPVRFIPLSWSRLPFGTVLHLPEPLPLTFYVARAC